MLQHFKRITLFTLCLFMGIALYAQSEDSVYSEADSLQDLQIEKINQQISTLKYLLKKSNEDMMVLADSLEIIYKILTEKDLLFQEADKVFLADHMALQGQVSSNHAQNQEGRIIYRRYFLIVVPLLLAIISLVFFLLYMMIGRMRKSTNANINALRKYSYEGIEEVRADYLKEIKRRVKKISVKLKGSGKKKGNRSKAELGEAKGRSKKAKAKAKGKK